MDVDRKRPSDGPVSVPKRVSLDEPLCAEDVEAFQKDAIFRQMNVYRRERDELRCQLAAAHSGDEALLSELSKLTEQYTEAHRQLERQSSVSVAKLLQQNGKPNAESPKTEESPAVKNEATTTSPESNSAENLALKESLALAEGETAKLRQTVQDLDKTCRDNDKTCRELQERLATFPAALQAADQRAARLQLALEQAEQTTLKLQEQLQEQRALQAEYEISAREKAASAIQALEKRVAVAESDVQRIRNHRDELLSEMNVLKAESAATRNELLRAQEALELGKQPETVANEIHQAIEAAMRTTLDELPLPDNDAECRERCAVLARENKALMSELTSLEQAFARASAKAKAGTRATQQIEQKLGVLNAAKVRSDEKYINAMRSRDADSQELSRAKQALARSADIIAELRASEQKLGGQITRAQQQIAQHNLQAINARHESEVSRRTQLESEQSVAQIKAALSALREQLDSQEAAKYSAEVARRSAETKIEQLDRQLKTLRAVTGASSASDMQEQLESLRSIAMCPVCQKNWKNRALTTCGHTMCVDCVQSRLAARMRKCPICNGHFASSDVLTIHL